MRLLISLLCSLILVTVEIAHCSEPDRQSSVGWRNDGTGHFPNCQPPTTWSKTTQVVWRTEMPGTSFSSPILVGESVYTMAEPSELICVNASDGQITWQQSHGYDKVFPPDKAQEIAAQIAEAQKVQEQINQLQKSRTEAQKSGNAQSDADLDAQIRTLQEQYEKMTPYPPPRTDGGGNTASTPIADGDSVYAIFANGIVSSHKLDGTRKWIRFLEKPELRHTSSPVLIGNLLIVHLKNLIALDADSGETRWQVATPARNGTAVSAQLGQTQWIITPGGSVVRADDGRVSAEKLFDVGYCSPIVHNGVLYIVERGSTKAVQLVDSGGGAMEPKTLWQVRSAEDDRLASPVLHDGLLYSVGGKGILDVFDAQTGERVQRKRLDLASGRVDASLAIAGNLLFISNNLGLTLLLKPGRDYEEVSRNELDGFSSSPFFSAQRLYIRAPKHLYCLGQ